MGHREDLLAGAKRCLYELGYARTTARDIVAASGTNLASIGYHFGSKEALLTEALIEATDEWAEEIKRVLATEAGADPFARFEVAWRRVLASFEADRRLWTSVVEALPLLERMPQLRERVAAGAEEARAALPAMMLGPAGDQAEAARSVGSLLYALLIGVLVQRLVDPGRSPEAADLAAGLRAVAAMVRPTGEEDGAADTAGTPAR